MNWLRALLAGVLGWEACLHSEWSGHDQETGWRCHAYSLVTKEWDTGKTG